MPSIIVVVIIIRVHNCTCVLLAKHRAVNHLVKPVVLSIARKINHKIRPQVKGEGSINLA